ncbi:hypothetical protein ACGFW5_12680 [Streptomyces sp. NPDC048416]|uniref:hypothetical protein n=1 Tax=Streptomyces sp. NPDC048416 TaxID=3365546 RepID=UPI0037171598
MSSDHSPSQDEQIPIGPGDEPRLLLLRTVATSRPMREVAALVHLLNQAGEYPRPGDQALRLAAVSRSVNEVHQLIALLQEPPSTAEDAGTALHAAAMERPIEEVAALIASFAPTDGEAPLHATVPAEGQVATAPSVPSDAVADAEDAAPATSAARFFAPGSAKRSERQAAQDTIEPAERFSEPERPFAEPAGAFSGPETALPPVPDAAPRIPAGAPRASEAAVAARADASGPSASRAVRSVLRWPAAVALLVIAAIHLPTDLRDLRSGDLAAGGSLAIAVVCLTLACLLPLYDPLWAWVVGAAAAVGTVAIHSLAMGLNSVHLLRDSLGSSFTGATRLMVLCAVIAAALAATVLTRKPRARVADEA